MNHISQDLKIYKPTKEDILICSKNFADWLLQISSEEGHAQDLWADVILRYCNAAY